MTDWVDEQIGGLCTDLQKQIRENPFLSGGAKQRFIEWLDECAAKAPEGDDRSASVNWEVRRIKEAYLRETNFPLTESRRA